MIILEIVAGALGFVYQMELVGHCVLQYAIYSVLNVHSIIIVQGDFVAVRVTSAFDQYNAEDNDVTTVVDFMQGEVIHILLAT